jgi:primosomal protein N' (replication factor Y)
VLFPINAGPFTYVVPDELINRIEVGLMVKAPFRRQKKTGIIFRLVNNKEIKNDIELKAIESVITEEPALPEGLLKLIQWVGQYYISTPGLALKNAVPSGIFEGKKGGRARITYDSVKIDEKRFRLNRGQKQALRSISSTSKGIFLLHGVTGSGKTEVYLRAIEDNGDREAIVLVPEIALTAQIIDRFRSRFGDKVAFYHSGLSHGERILQWKRMLKGEVKIVVGVRSAVFAPFRNLGLIVIDEEHEPTYKQFEGLRYSARDVALARSKIEGIKIILGSATPSIESFYNAMKGNINYLELKQRVEEKPLPEVEIIDMTKEEKKTPFFSKRFIDALSENINSGKQSLLMLNRRGYSPFYLCTDCGYTYKCPSCSISLKYHKDTNTLNCHYCNTYLKVVDLCPRCNGAKTKTIGAGTQRIEEELRRLISRFSLKRMDRDTTRKKLAHYRIVKEMEQGQIDVLVGTQMVAKGHDFPNVTFSGVILADVALNLPDFRSAERTFQLFIQLAGRAGRGIIPGMVYIQTYETHHYVFHYIQTHDYRGFFQKELSLRKELQYPPFSKLIRLIFNFKEKNVIEDTIKRLKKVVNSIKTEEVQILGPAPAPIEKIRNLHRWHLILKGKKASQLRIYAIKILDSLKDMNNVKVEVDVDPVNLL